MNNTEKANFKGQILISQFHKSSIEIVKVHVQSRRDVLESSSAEITYY